MATPKKKPVKLKAQGIFSQSNPMWDSQLAAVGIQQNPTYAPVVDPYAKPTRPQWEKRSPQIVMPPAQPGQSPFAPSTPNPLFKIVPEQGVAWSPVTPYDAQQLPSVRPPVSSPSPMVDPDANRQQPAPPPTPTMGAYSPPAQRDQALALSSPDPYQREWARMQAEEAVKRSGQEVAANVQDALKTGRPGELGANFRPIWDAQQGINTARQYGDAREGSLYGARPAPQNEPILSGAYEGMAPSAFRTGPLVGTERRYGDAPLQPVRTDEMIQQEQTAALNARMGLAAGAGRDARMEVAKDRLNDMYAAHPELAADRVAAKATGLAQREAAKAKIAADVEQAGGFDAFMAMRRAESRAAVKNIRETGDPNMSLSGLKSQAQERLGKYASQTLTDEGKAEYGQLRGAMKTIESSRLRGPQKAKAYRQLMDKIESSGLDSLVVKNPDLNSAAEKELIERNGVTMQRSKTADGQYEWKVVHDGTKTALPPKDFESYLRSKEGLEAWQSTYDRLDAANAARREPPPTDAQVRQAMMGWWNAGSEGDKSSQPAGAYAMTPPASGPAAPQSGTDMMSVDAIAFPKSEAEYAALPPGTDYKVQLDDGSIAIKRK